MFSPRSGGATATRPSLLLTANCSKTPASWTFNVAAEFWSLAALDAGAAHVVALESRRKPIESAMETFAKYGVKSESYRIRQGRRCSRALRTFSPGEFDLILCLDSVSDLYSFFREMQRLRPKHVIVDGAITHRKRPVVIFKTTTFKLRVARYDCARSKEAANRIHCCCADSCSNQHALRTVRVSMPLH